MGPFSPFDTLDLVTLDPGRTTGYAIFNDHGVLVDAGEFTTFEALRKLLEVPVIQMIVCERVIARSASFDQFAVEVMGAIHYISSVHSIPIKFQSPSMMTAPRTWPNCNLNVIKSPHARDAVAHALAFLRRTNFPLGDDQWPSSP